MPGKAATEEEVPRKILKDWLMQSSEKTKPRKTSNMMHVKDLTSTKVKNALLKI